MNAVSFTQSFDACVGHAKQVNEKYKGHEIDLEESASGREVAYYVDGKRGLLRTASIDEARRAAREVVDNMERERRK